MAKARALPADVAAFIKEHLHEGSGPVVLDIPAAPAQRNAKPDLQDRTRPSIISDPSPIQEQTGTGAFKVPGELERVLEGIKEGFRLADQRHRTAIDQQVKECFRVAAFLKHNWRGGERLLNGEWVKYWADHGRNGNEALRFVFKKVHSDPKKASFYFRATNKLFQEGVSIKDLTARVTAAGGYQELADCNVEKPRERTAAKPATRNDGDGDRDRLDAELERTKKRRVKSKVQQVPAADKTPLDNELADDIRLVTVISSKSIEFFALSLPCAAKLDVELWQNADGKWMMKIVEVNKAE